MGSSNAPQLLYNHRIRGAYLRGGSDATWRAARNIWTWLGCPSPLQKGPAVWQVLALFGALLHGSLYLVLGATTLLPQALRAALRAASRQRTSLLQARACALPQRHKAARPPVPAS